MITGADCFPVFFYDSTKNVIGVAHCGWRGILDELPAKMIEKFKSDFGSNPTDIAVWIGPGIKSCHYDIPQERAELFFSRSEITRRMTKDYKEYIMIRGNKIFLDLVGIMTLQLTKAGVKSEKITTHPDCTFCERKKYFSNRRDKLENPKPIKAQRIVEANAYIINLK